MTTEDLQQIGSLLNQQLSQALAPIQVHLEKMDGRLDRLEQRMDGLEQRMDGFEQRMDGLEQRMDGFEHELAAQKEYEQGTRLLLEQTDRNVQLIAEQHGAIMQKLETLEAHAAQAADVQGRVQVLENVVTHHTAQIRALEKAQ